MSFFLSSLTCNQSMFLCLFVFFYFYFFFFFKFYFIFKLYITVLDLSFFKFRYESVSNYHSGIEEVGYKLSEIISQGNTRSK